MNTIDIVMLAILGLSVLIGLYRGFIASVASLGGCFLSLGLSAWLTPKLAAWVQTQSSVMEYVRAVIETRLGGLNLAGGITISDSPFPGPVKTLLQDSLQKQVIRSEDMAGVSRTITNAAVNVVCYIACFLICLLVLHIVINFLKEVFKFPVLKQMNAVAGGLFGLLRGALLCFLAAALLPLAQTVMEFPGMDRMVAESRLVPLFNWNDLIALIMRLGN